MKFVTVQLAERLRHPPMKNRFAMVRMPTGTMFSYGLRSKCADLVEYLLKFDKMRKKQLTLIILYNIILSLTVDGRKNRCIPCIYWAAAIFAIVADYSNLFLSLTFFLNRSHFTFGYELIVRPETTGFMKIIRNLFPPVQWYEPLFLYPGKIHRF